MAGLPDLELRPPKPVFAAANNEYIVSAHQLVNNSTNKVAVKIKCSDNRIYRPGWVFGMIEQGGEKNLTIHRLGEAPPKKDKLVMQAVRVPGEVEDARKVFRNRPRGPDSELVLQLFGPTTDSPSTSTS